MTTVLTGLTWDHPRGREALEAARAHAASVGVDLTWDVQSLEGFESAPIAELAQRYDVIVLDHPHLGDALASRCLRPMEAVVGSDVLKDIAHRAVGPSLASYRLAGSTWALPLDAATQVSARRTDLLDQEPRTWSDVVSVSARHPVALSVSGPHAYLSFASICHSFGAPLSGGASETIVDTGVGSLALGILRELSRRGPRGSEAQNPIALLERMITSDDIAYIPLVYGYVNYANRRRTRAVTFADAPEGVGGVTGSTIGGTGIAVTTRAEVAAGLRKHLVWLLGDQTQTGFIPLHQGQPSVRAAWEDDAVNGSTGDFYRRTRRTIERAWVRPRFAGFVQLQRELSRVIREALANDSEPRTVLERMTALQNDAVARADLSTFEEAVS
ncbi:carbohydrate ABC transporter substrate-binding protein (CUT1 family) [Microbacterium sp. SLBN-154]|uniref:carbohydrate ABC transporter substrate-binding protein n=1 Tax=Microbacterium sp. SLBN-154 TaxID=2768458 RepID=UPI00114FF4E1|nr:carbohydrate ABC transporter substrate-binding protein [Microbacterium sp. SLBN-154]TQK17689.1 carbohydrate ABC transporter substrate-binding protein (CUT1 family) [Microbacterium sp. SLBN-154]